MAAKVHARTSVRKRSAEDRFWPKVDKNGPTQPHMDTPCWEWTACRDRGRYGRFGRDGVTLFAHRVAWELANGPIPDGLCALHRCDNPSCVRVDHLFLGTNLDNMNDKVAKGRTACRLTAAAVLEIRRRCARGETGASVARAFRASETTISRIVNRVAWRRLDPDGRHDPRRQARGSAARPNIRHRTAASVERHDDTCTA